MLQRNSLYWLLTRSWDISLNQNFFGILAVLCSEKKKINEAACKTQSELQVTLKYHFWKEISVYFTSKIIWLLFILYITLCLYSFCYLHTHTHTHTYSLTVPVSLGNYGFLFLKFFFASFFYLILFLLPPSTFSWKFFHRLGEKLLSVLCFNVILAEECLFLRWFALV